MNTLMKGAAGERSGSIAPVEERPKFLSEADCREILQRVKQFSRDGGYASVKIWSSWTGNVRWARNQVSTSGEVRNNVIRLHRNINGATSSDIFINQTSDAALIAGLRRAERLVRMEPEQYENNLTIQDLLAPEPVMAPRLFSEATYQLDAHHRAVAARTLAQSAVAAGMLSAGYIEVAARSVAALDTLGRVRYFAFTQAQYSVTVRDPQGTGSGWAGLDGYDWSRIDGEHLSQVALEKCLQSRNPVAVEPGRYTTILEPQAVADFALHLVGGGGSTNTISRSCAELPCSPTSPYKKKEPRGDKWGNIIGYSRLGERIVDERLTVSADPMDPELGFPPFGLHGFMDEFDFPVYHPATWIKDGILVNLAYERQYAIDRLGSSTGLPNSGAFRMSGGTTSIEEMIATTKRGLLVTRFDQVTLLAETSLLLRGNTRDGLWLIENGKISKPVKNLTFTESVLFALNHIEQLGVPQRVFHPPAGTLELPAPVVVPSLKITDFSFTALDDAI